MKATFGQYAKVVILVLAVMGLVAFIFSSGDASFIGKMQVTKPEAEYGKEDNGELLDEIALREKPTISITSSKLKNGQYYTFIDFASATFQDDTTTDQKLYVKSIKLPNGTVERDQEILKSPIRVIRGTYTVTYRAEETYKGSTIKNEKTAKFIVDKN